MSLDRAVVLRQPWAQAVAEGALPLLIRPQPTNFREWVGILTPEGEDPGGFYVGDERLPRRAIIGAVEIADCVSIEGSAPAFLADKFDPEMAEFYPRHYIPETDVKHIWLFSRSMKAEEPREWSSSVPRTWARCNTWIEGEPTDLLSLPARGPTR